MMITKTVRQSVFLLVMLVLMLSIALPVLADEKSRAEAAVYVYRNNLMPVEQVEQYYLENARGTPAYAQLLQAVESLKKAYGLVPEGAHIPTKGELWVLENIYMKNAVGTPAYDGMKQVLDVMEHAYENGSYYP